MSRLARLSEATQWFYLQKLGLFLDYLDMVRISAPAELETRYICDCMTRVADKHSPGRCAAYYRAIRALVRFLVREEIVERDPVVSSSTSTLDEWPMAPPDQENLGPPVASSDRSHATAPLLAQMLTQLEPSR